MKRYMWPIATLMAVVLAGLAVLITPFALRLNPGGSWTAATNTMFWSGVGLVVVGLAALAGWQRELRQALALALPAPLDADLAADLSAEPEAPSPEAQWEADLVRLTEAVLQDLRSETGSPARAATAAPPPNAAADEPDADDLLAVVSQLQRDLASRRANHLSTGGPGAGGGSA